MAQKLTRQQLDALHHYQTDGANSITDVLNADNILIQSGWGQVAAGAVNQVAGTITFPEAFDSAPFCLMVMPIGYRTNAASTPNNFATDFGGYVVGKATSASEASINFVGRNSDTTLGGTNIFLGFYWIAIGIKANNS